MLTHEIEGLAARHVPGGGTVDIRCVSGGLVNETYRVVRDGCAYALRVTSPNPGDLGLDGAWEGRVLELAAAADLAPVPVFCDPGRRILISRWVEGRSWNPADVRSPENISRMSGLMRRIHAVPAPVPVRRMSPAQWIEHYSAAAPDRNAGRTPLAARLRTAADARLAELDSLPAMSPVLCHSDLHALNLIDRGSALILLDWEYAHAADPVWDLAGWSSNNDFDDDLRSRLLAAYTGRPPAAEEKFRLRLECWLYDYVCLLWSELYADVPRAARPFAAGGSAAETSSRKSVAARARELAARLGARTSGRAP